jgi:ankyrin repeat protein
MAALADAPRGARSRCALHFHARRGDAGAITRFLRVADADVRDAAGDTPLHHACAAQGGHAAAVRALLRGGADANAENARALSPSVVAAAQPAGAGGRANAALVALLEAGACVNAELSAARPLSPLIKSIAAGVVANAEALLDAGADVNASNHLKTSPLLMACSPAAAIADPRERLRLVELLLREGADVSARNVDGLSAVHLAAKLGDAAVLRVVLHAIRGADAVGADARAAAACNAAAASGCEQRAALTAYAALSRALGTRSRSLSLSPSGALSHSVTPLHFAAKRGFFGAAQVLLAAGACVNAQDIDGATPLALACELVELDRSKGGGEGEGEGEGEGGEQWTEGEDEEEEEEEAGEGAKAAASEHKSVVMVGVRTRAGTRELSCECAPPTRADEALVLRARLPTRSLFAAAAGERRARVGKEG